MAASVQPNLFAAEEFTLDPSPWELAAESDQLAAHVVVNRPLTTTFTYLIPDPLRDLVGPGQRVRVPFGRGNRTLSGICVKVGPVPATTRELKSIESVIDREPLLPPQMLELTRWIADRYLCGWGQVLHSVVPAGVKKRAGTRVVLFFELSESGRAALASGERIAAKQRAVLEALAASPTALRGEELAEAAKCGTAPIEGARKKGWLRALRQRTDVFEPAASDVAASEDLRLNIDQMQALQAIVATLRAGEHRTFLLHGVTGSGKTEVYIQAIREIVSYGRQAIVLVPEISLTPQTIRRFRSRFDSVAVLHSHLTDAERHWQWQQIARGGVQVIVGARSAVFAPAPNLGLIVIDEEHETSFKQDTAPRYHAREVARQRCLMEKIPLVLGSATPTLESWYRTQPAGRDAAARAPDGIPQGRPSAASSETSTPASPADVLISLPKRVEARPLPPVIVVDVRNDPRIQRGAAIGRALESAVRNSLHTGGQVILFLNLRGYAPTLWCRGCGEGVKCPHCDITLTWHRDRNVALCHNCEYEAPPITQCPRCGAGGIRYLGIGTEKLEKEVVAMFPEAKCLRMDSDSMKRPGSHDAALEAFRKGEVQILVGTQMIAKGLDFPNVTLVGVVNADTILHQPDLRASERTFQLISQVAGRTGRGARGGRVLVQTSCPNEPAILKAAAHDYLGFVRHEMPHRRDMEAPPYRSLARIVVRGPDEAKLREFALKMAAVLKEGIATIAPVRLLGPAPCPVAKLNDNYRYHFQLSARTLEPIQQLWRDVLPRLPSSDEIESIVDVDPINMR